MSKKKFQIIPEIKLKDGSTIKKHVRQINKDQTIPQLKPSEDGSPEKE